MKDAFRRLYRIPGPMMLVGYFRNPDVPLLRKLLVVGALLYILSPVDAIPDVIPFVGWLDDIGVLGIVVGLIMRDVRRRTVVAPARSTERLTTAG